MENLKVIFRKSKNPYTNKYEVVAFFPESSANYGKIESYMHIGQHCESSVDFYHSTTKATPDEYAELLSELKGIYNDVNLRVMQRLNYKDLYKAWKN